MNRRTMIIGLAGAAALGSRALAVEKPFRVSLVGDEFIGEGWQTGVRIELAAGWKTYWRMPGEAGIPPEFNWTTSVPAHVEVLYPGPGRFAVSTAPAESQGAGNVPGKTLSARSQACPYSGVSEGIVDTRSPPATGHPAEAGGFRSSA